VERWLAGRTGCRVGCTTDWRLQAAAAYCLLTVCYQTLCCCSRQLLLGALTAKKVLTRRVNQQLQLLTCHVCAVCPCVHHNAQRVALIIHLTAAAAAAAASSSASAHKCQRLQQ
jgi:hypothetical protein